MVAEKMAKGAVLNGYLKFIKKKWGIDGLQAAAKYAGIEENPKDGEWIPAEMATSALTWIMENKGEKYVVEAGRYATTDLGVFTYIVASFMSVEKFIKRARDTYKTLFNYGDFVIEEGNNKAIITIKNAKHPEPSCLAWEGALQGILEITKNRGKVTPVEPDNEEDCKYVVEWY